MIATREVIHVSDVMASEAFAERDPPTVAAVELGGVRTLLVVPMLKDNVLIGALTLARQEVQPFSGRQIALVQNFASQAVIAIENARLLKGLRHSLEQQTATTDVLKVVSGSSGELQAVFDAILKNATTLCQASLGTMALYEEGGFRHVKLHGAPPAYVEAVRQTPLLFPKPGAPLDLVAKTKEYVHVPDYLQHPPEIQGRLAKLAGARTLLIVPMLKGQILVGVIGVYRHEVRPFSEDQIALMQNFATQAVIAIENARLLNELRQRTTDLTERTADLTEALERQTATSEVLQVISSSPGGLARYSTPCWKKPFVSATQSSEVSFAGRTKPRTSLPRIMPRLPSPRHAAIHKTLPIRKLLLVAWSRPELWFMSPMQRRSRATSNYAIRQPSQQWNLEANGQPRMSLC